MVNALLIQPKNPTTFWTFDEALKLAGKKAAFPPTNLLTIAGLLPEKYNIRLVDENTTKLEDKDFEWADVGLVSGMIIHRDSQEKIIERAKQHEKPIIIGGQYATQYSTRIKGPGTVYMGEAETALLDVLEDVVEKGYREETRIIDKSDDFVDVEKIPFQRLDLIRDTMRHYGTMAIQVTRGCPKPCTFCDIPKLTGKITRVKNVDQIIPEFDMLYNMGWRGSVMLVDDNLAGNMIKIMDRLKHITPWQQERRYPFPLFTQSSLDMYENKEFMEAMRNAGFDTVFFGLESPAAESLKSMGAQKNLQGKDGKSMLDKIRDIQSNYFKAQAGFILGLDADPDDIDEQMKQFIQQSRIGVAMAGPLGVVPGTPDYKRFSREGRLVEDVIYDGGSGIFTRKLSYKPKNNKGEFIEPDVILNRHKSVVGYINSPEAYFERTLDYIRNRERMPLSRRKMSKERLMSFLRSVYYQGIKSDYKKEYWNYLFNSAKHDIKSFPDAVTYAIHGHHLITTTKESLKAEKVNESLENLVGKAENIGDTIRDKGREYLQDIVEKYRNVREDFRHIIEPRYRALLE